MSVYLEIHHPALSESTFLPIHPIQSHTKENIKRIDKTPRK